MADKPSSGRRQSLRRRQSAIHEFFRRGSVISERFTIKRSLGAGGSGQVYLVDDAKRGGQLALKILTGDLGEDGAVARRRFEREVHTLAKVKHPNLIRLHGAGEHEGIPYFTMAYLPGPSLRSLIQGRAPFSALAALGLARKLAGAVAALHVAGILHRDLKPENVLHDERGEPIITDLGLAIDGEGTRLTDSGRRIGSLPYMPPERIIGEGDLDPRCDVFALGVILFEMLTATVPFPDRSFRSALSRAMKLTEPPSLASVLGSASPKLESLCAHALAPHPGKRIATAEAFIAELDLVTEHLLAESGGL